MKAKIIILAAVAALLIMPAAALAQYSGADLEFWNTYLADLWAEDVTQPNQMGDPPFDFTEIVDVNYASDGDTITNMQITFMGSDGNYHVLSTVVGGGVPEGEQDYLTDPHADIQLAFEEAWKAAHPGEELPPGYTLGGGLYYSGLWYLTNWEEERPGDPDPPGGPGDGDGGDSNDPGDDDDTSTTPTVTPTRPATPTPQPTEAPTATATPVGGCNPSSLTRQTGTLEIKKTAPPYPVVVGQDPTNTGVDVYLKIVSYPVVYSYEKYELVSSTTKCGWDDPNDDTGEAVCYYPEPGCAQPVNPCQQDPVWENWKWYTEEDWGCVRYEEKYADPVDLGTLRVQANLTQESKDWIRGKLASKYPGATVRHPDWELIPVGGWQAHQSLDGNKVYVLEGTVEHVQLEDPGWYQLLIAGRTTGTPYSAPAAFYDDTQLFDVALIDTALIE